MKRINEKIKNLFKVEINKDIFKISLTLVLYCLILITFRAGYEFKNFSQVSKKTTKPKINEYKYYITYKGDQDQYNFNEPQTLFSLVDGLKDVEIDVISYYEGNEITAISGNKNFKIKLNGNEIESNFFNNKDQALNSGTKIEIVN